MCGFYCIAFLEYMLAGKTSLDYSNLSSLNDYKRMTKKYMSMLKINMVEEASPEIRLRKTDETGNYLLDEIKHSNLISEKYQKTFKYLNYVENLPILVSTATGCV